MQPIHRLDPTTVKQVLRYFVCRPHAADDLEGVARWRLAEAAICNTVDETQRALAWLVERDYLCLTRTAGATPLFSLNAGKIAEATALLCGDPQVDTACGSNQR